MARRQLGASPSGNFDAVTVGFMGQALGGIGALLGPLLVGAAGYALWRTDIEPAVWDPRPDSFVPGQPAARLFLSAHDPDATAPTDAQAQDVWMSADGWFVFDGEDWLPVGPTSGASTVEVARWITDSDPDAWESRPTGADLVYFMAEVYVSTLPDDAEVGDLLVRRGSANLGMEMLVRRASGWATVGAGETDLQQLFARILPDDGATGQILRKASSADGDAEWDDDEAFPLAEYAADLADELVTTIADLAAVVEDHAVRVMRYVSSTWPSGDIDWAPGTVWMSQWADDAPPPSGAGQEDLWFAHDGIYVLRMATWEPYVPLVNKPYSATATSNSAGLVTFALPTGRFSVAPKVTATCNTTTQTTVTMVETVSTTSVTVRVRYWASTTWATTSSFAVTIVAVA